MMQTADTLARFASMGGEALKVASYGLPIIPVSPQTKRPICEHGFHDATTDAVQIKQWWTDNPRAMIGVRTGAPSGLAVLDLDIETDPATGEVLKDGYARLKEWLALQGLTLPDTMEVRTPRGGRHLYFRHDGGFSKSRAHEDLGIDYRCENGYVIFPPSIRADGAAYRFANPYPLFEPVDAPEWLAKFFRTDTLPGLIEAKAKPEYSGDSSPPATPSTGTSRPEDVERALYQEWNPDSFDDWTTAALALHAMPEGKDIWLKWSATSPKFNRAENEKKWSQTEPARGITERSILARVPKATLSEWGRQQRANPLAEMVSRAQTSVPLPTPSNGPTEAPRPRIEVLSISDLRQLPPAKWLIERQMYEDGWGYIWGAPSCGKSFVALDQALHVAYARPTWHFGAKVNVSGPVLYILQEGVRSFAKRIDAWKAHHKVAEDTGQFRLIRQRLNFMDTNDIAALVETIKAQDMPFRLIVLDTVSRVIPGADENAQKEMTLFVEANERVREVTGATLLGIHHANGSGESERGSTVLRGAADFVFRLDKTIGENRVKMTCTKMKDDEDGWHRDFDLARVETFSPFGSTSSLVVTEAAPETAPDQVALDHVMRVLIERGALNQTEVRGIVRDRFMMPEHPTRKLIESWVHARRTSLIEGAQWRIEARQGVRNQQLIAAARAE